MKIKDRMYRRLVIFEILCVIIIIGLMIYLFKLN